METNTAPELITGEIVNTKSLTRNEYMRNYRRRVKEAKEKAKNDIANGIVADNGSVGEILNNIKGLGEISVHSPNKDKVKFAKDLNKARKVAISKLTEAKLDKCKALALTRVIKDLDEMIRTTEGEGQSGTYERRITISGTAKNRSVELRETVSGVPSRHQDGYLGPVPTTENVGK